METIYRQWLILRMIPRRGKISTRDILNRLEMERVPSVTIRTVQRDLNDLSRYGFPLDCDNNRPAGWQWSKDASLVDIPNMDPVTALTFRLVRQHIDRMMPGGVLQTLDPYFKRANEIAKTIDSKLGSWPDKVRVLSRSMNSLPPEVDPDIAETTYIALLEDRQFNATYQSVRGRVKGYKGLSSLGLVFVEGEIYLIALDGQTVKMMLLHRFRKADLLDVPAITPEGFNLDEYVASEFKYPLGDDIKLIALFSEEYDINRLREMPIVKDQVIGKEGERWRLEATVTDSYHLRWWLRSYGDRMEVLAPPPLRQEFTESAGRMAAMYQRPL